MRPSLMFMYFMFVYVLYYRLRWVKFELSDICSNENRWERNWQWCGIRTDSHVIYIYVIKHMELSCEARYLLFFSLVIESYIHYILLCLPNTHTLTLVVSRSLICECVSVCIISLNHSLIVDVMKSRAARFSSVPPFKLCRQRSLTQLHGSKHTQKCVHQL